MMKKYLTILYLVLGAAVTARAEIPAGWGTNFAAALSEAGGGQKPALFFFTASWCGPCKMMAGQTLSDPAVRQALSNFADVAIDIDEHPDMAAKHAIEAVPTFVLLAAGGEEVRRATGFQPPGDFLQWLTNGIAAVKQAALRREILQKKLVEIDDLLASTNAAAPRQCAAQLLDLCAQRDEAAVQMAGQRLRALASRQPAALLDGLNDPRLPARIQAANALRLQLGEGFDVDPWAAAATRASAVENWRKRLAPGDANLP